MDLSAFDEDSSETTPERAVRFYRINPLNKGTDTEPQYFRAMKDIINQQYRGKIQLDIYGEGDNILSLFEKAKNRADENPNGYKHVWVVYEKMAMGNSFKCERSIFASFWKSGIVFRYLGIWCICGVFNN